MSFSVLYSSNISIWSFLLYFDEFLMDDKISLSLIFPMVLSFFILLQHKLQKIIILTFNISSETFCNSKHINTVSYDWHFFIIVNLPLKQRSLLAKGTAAKEIWFFFNTDKSSIMTQVLSESPSLLQKLTSRQDAKYSSSLSMD